MYILENINKKDKINKREKNIINGVTTKRYFRFTCNRKKKYSKIP